MLHGGERVSGFAGLTDSENGAVYVDSSSVLLNKFRGDNGMGCQKSQLGKHVGGGEAGVVGGSGSHQENLSCTV